MSSTNGIAKTIAMALVAVALAGVLVPVCTMAHCDNTGVGTCSDFTPACDRCPKPVVMKHTHDDAVSFVAPAFDDTLAVAFVAPVADPALASLALAAPAATAAPPPLDPLGVRLTV